MSPAFVPHQEQVDEPRPKPIVEGTQGQNSDPSLEGMVLPAPREELSDTFPDESGDEKDDREKCGV
jgi:hypothetical protein